MASPRTATVVIRPSSGWIGLGAIELWKHRDLAYFLVWRDLKVRYKQTAFGAAWAVLQPVLLMLVFSAFLGQIKGIGSSDVPYPLFALSGLVPWTLFSQSLSGASNSLVNSQNLISKVYFPRLLLPLSAVASYVIDFLIAAVVLVIAMLFFGRVPPATFLLVPLLGLFAVVVALAVGLWLAAINVRYRDVKYAIPFLIQLWLFASPVAYSSDLVPSGLRPLLSLNPMTGVINGFRWAALGGPRPDLTILVSAAATVVILLGGLAYFRRVERTFADTI
ncbi:MAG: ABC transporter permease [Chloroflexota bacterium]|nr:ABC transporter permease [Chloroflexota bacterium]